MTNESSTQTQGLSILDIAVQFTDVPISDVSLRVYGVAAQDVVVLLQRFPEAQTWFTGQGFDVATLAKRAPELVAAIIAAAAHQLNNPQAEERAAQFSVEEQLDILEAVGRLTFKNGFGPFVSRLAILARLVVSANSGKATDTNLQPPSTASLPVDTTPSTSGN